jgi:O-methyltransferase involved in polyketide biosynthesis
MSVTLPAFTPLEDSLFLTLYARALDSRRPHPILGDATADQIVRTTDYDYDTLRIETNLILSVALRARKLDQVASAFLARHPDAVGLDLGAGLDTRFERLAPPATVADGMMAFLSQDELVSLWNRLVSHFPSGEIVLNSYTRFAIWIAQHARGTKSVADLVKFPGMDDPRAPEGWNPKLKLVREILLSREPEVAEFPPGWRTYHRLAARSTAWSRTGTIVLHYRF